MPTIWAGAGCRSPSPFVSVTASLSASSCSSKRPISHFGGGEEKKQGFSRLLWSGRIIPWWGQHRHASLLNTSRRVPHHRPFKPSYTTSTTQVSTVGGHGSTFGPRLSFLFLNDSRQLRWDLNLAHMPHWACLIWRACATADVWARAWCSSASTINGLSPPTSGLGRRWVEGHQQCFRGKVTALCRDGHSQGLCWEQPHLDDTGRPLLPPPPSLVLMSASAQNRGSWISCNVTVFAGNNLVWH